MKQLIRRLFSLAIAFAVCFCSTMSVSAHDRMTHTSDSQDIFANGYQEDVTIDGIVYTYQYCYDSDGNRVTNVLNHSTNIVDEVKYDIKSQYIMLNGNVVGNVTFSEEKTRVNFFEKSSDDAWLYFDSGSHKITFAQGVAVSVLSVMIATAIGNLGGAAVLAAMGYNALAAISAAAIGGTVSTTVYKFNSNLITQWRYDWSFTASTGDYYGEYTSLSEIT